MAIRKSRTANTKERKKFSFQLGLSGFLSLAMLIIVGMAWSFILGVIVGRGYQPEKIALNAAQKVLPEDFPLLTEKNEPVLKSEELEFFDKLKKSSDGVTTVASQARPATPQQQAAPAQAKPQDATAAKANPKPGSVAPAKPEQAPKPQPKPESKPAQPTSAEPPGTKEEVFVFNYQVAALASMEQAQTFLKQIEPGGFKSSVVTATHEGKTWYRIYVHHQGTVESAMALKEKLKASGISNVLLRSRTPL